MKKLMNAISQGNSVHQTLTGACTVLAPGQESDSGPAPWKPGLVVKPQAWWEWEEQETPGAGALEGGFG